MFENKVAVAMSGGVDSSAAVKLLQDRGYEVVGITMMVEGYFSSSVVEDAKAVAKKLGITHYTVDLTKDFNKEVIDYFTNEYLLGRTPNPCVVCNPKIKFGKLLEKCDEVGAKYLATGHYAEINQSTKTNRYRIKNIDNQKDQSYFLWGLTQEQLSRTLFPLSNYNKDQIRAIASDIGLSVADKPDSMEICFVNEDDYREFLMNKIPESLAKIGKGDYLYEGKRVGKHEGYYNYTIGQRRGLGIALGIRAFVTDINVNKNEITLGKKEDLLTNIVKATNINLVSSSEFIAGDKVYGKIRFNNKSEEATIIKYDENELIVEFVNPKSGPTPGQSLVLYDEEGYILAGGVID